MYHNQEELEHIVYDLFNLAKYVLNHIFYNPNLVHFIRILNKNQLLLHI